MTGYTNARNKKHPLTERMNDHMKKTKIGLVALVLAGALLAGCTGSTTVSSESAVAPAASPSGTVTPRTDTQSTATSTAASGSISEEEAKKIALEHAGLTEADVTFVHVKLDRDDGRLEYEVEFYKDNTEYDYDIDANTGEILSFDQDAEYYTPGQAQSGAQSGQITQDEALAAALAHAGLAQTDISRLKVELDYDDGRSVYELEWDVDRTEYSYEVDASTGEILSYEKELD